MQYFDKILISVDQGWPYEEELEELGLTNDTYYLCLGCTADMGTKYIIVNDEGKVVEVPESWIAYGS